MMRENKGLGKQINENLNKFCLSNDIEEIRNKSMTKWKRELAEKSNIFNTDLMKQMCVEKKNGGLSVKSIKALIMGRAQMLWCTNNFKGTNNNNVQCQICRTTDDEKHRLNWCPKWKHLREEFAPSLPH